MPSVAKKIPKRHQNKPLELHKIKVKKDDTVKVISGRDKGKTGRVLDVAGEQIESCGGQQKRAAAHRSEAPGTWRRAPEPIEDRRLRTLVRSVGASGNQQCVDRLIKAVANHVIGDQPGARRASDMAGLAGEDEESIRRPAGLHIRFRKDVEGPRDIQQLHARHRHDRDRSAFWHHSPASVWVGLCPY